MNKIIFTWVPRKSYDFEMVDQEKEVQSIKKTTVDAKNFVIHETAN